MSDLINRADAINAFWEDSDIRTAEVRATLKALPSADAKQGEWIPCSERLPKAKESVLIATSLQHDNWVGEGCYWETTKNHVIWKGYRWNATYWDNEVLAWMPLPKPYREDGEDYELATEQMEHDAIYESTYNPEDGSM